MTGDLFPSVGHDAGGKTRRRWPDDCRVAAVFDGANDCYRTILSVTWDESAPAVLWVMMNPSVATVEYADPTLIKTLGFTRRWVSKQGRGYGRMLIGNIHAYRATDNRRLMDVADPVGPSNDTALLHMAQNSEIVVLAYGLPPMPLRARGMQVAFMLKTAGADLRVMKLTADGTPSHPLYLPHDTKPVPFDPFTVAMDAT
jgi:hypothetical protein